ncbi:MAG: hypothetical protein WB930_20230 [Syntrophobacteraceae bacterium]
MLNELYHLSTVLEDAGIAPYDWHKDLKLLPNASERNPCYCILVALNGSITGVEPMTNERVAFLRKWEPSNGNSFPGFNIQPLYRITDEASKKLLKKWRGGKEHIDLNMIREWCMDPHAKNWDAKFSKKMNKCLGPIPQELQVRCANISTDFGAVKKLCERIVQLGNGGLGKFSQALESFIWRSFERGEHARSLLPVLIHEGSSSKKPEADRGSISVFLDVPDWKEYPVAHEKTIKCINECFVGQESSAEAGNDNKDAFGRGAGGQEEKLPEVKLPVIGGVKLRAMNSESPCQYRYKTIDARSYRIGSDSRKRAKGALEWLKDESREGQTWGRSDDKELLFAYPTIMPKASVKLASCFGARKQDDTEARFARYAEDVVSCLKGLSLPLKDIELRVFALRKMDKARTKVVFHRNYSAQRLADAAKEWQQGCANIPPIRMKIWGEAKGETVLAEPETPFPLQISDCLNRVWKLDGTTRDEVKSIPKSSGIELLLDEFAAMNQAPHLLAVALQNSKGVFLSLGNALHGNEVLNLAGFNKQKQLMPAILGLLLWKLGVEKEVYMNNAPYLVGRMLKLADELHALYCKEVRNGSLPPQLLGNALMASALDSPTQAVAQLALRIAPYLGWARTNSTGVAGLSRYLLKEFGLVGGRLRGAALPTRFDDSARAQLLLGYISSKSQAEDPIEI